MKNSRLGFIIILGSPNNEKGELFNIAIERCNLALKEYNNHPGWKFLLTGGFGEHFNKTHLPHAQYLKEYLISKGISEKDFVEFALSKNTIEDAELSRKIVEKHKVNNVLIVTSDYHFNRADYIFSKIFENTDIRTCFSISKTNRENCGIDLESQIKHEKKSLTELMKKFESN